MRFVFAIISFALALVMVGYGVAQRTILAQPNEVALSTVVSSTAPVTIIDGATLNAFSGSQTLTMEGAGRVFAAYGRTTDVRAWIGDASYSAVTYDKVSGKLVSTTVTGAKAEVPDPSGSDLWLAEYIKEKKLEVTVKVPGDISFIIVSDGKQPAPGILRLSWPLDNSTPWAGPLIVGGAFMLLLGLGFLLWATNHMRSGRGPRRKPQKMPRLPRKRGYKPARKAIERPASGRRRGMIAVPAVLIGTLVLSGCGAGISPGASPFTPTPTASDASLHAQPDPPAVTVRQIQRIISTISAVAQKADAARDATLLATRFDGAALQLRLANYAIRGTDPGIAALPAIPDGPVTLTLPQQTDAWPRAVFAIIQNDKDAKVPPIALFLVQKDARSDYKVDYAITLEPAANLPNVAPASVGAARLAADSGVLKMTPTAVALAYGEILEKDLESAAFLDFETKGDSLRTAVGLAAKLKIKASLPNTASATFGHSMGSAPAIAFATNDGGALVAVNLNETTTVAPVEAGAAVNPSGSVKALSGIAISTKGVLATYGDQLLFYVPPAGSAAKIVLLGYSQGLVAAKEIG